VDELDEGKGRLFASCIRNIHTENNKNLIIFQVTIRDAGDPFWMQCSQYTAVCKLESTRWSTNLHQALYSSSVLFLTIDVF